MPALRAVIYCRISNDAEGEALGVSRQEADCRTLADARGWEVIETCADNDISASGKKVRPCWEHVLDLIGSGKVDALIAYSSSRLYRRPADLGRLLRAINGKAFEVATVASGKIDLSTADGRMVANLLVSIDQGELERVSERQTRKRKELREAGLFLGGRIPFGYEVKDSKLVPVPAEAKAIRDATKRLLNAATLTEIADDWNAKSIYAVANGKPWTISHLRKTLQTPKPGILADSDHQKLLAWFESNKVSPDSRRARHGSYMLHGLASCGECGALLQGRPNSGIPRYVCIKTDGTKQTYHMGIQARAVEYLVGVEASHRYIPKPQTLLDLQSPLLAEREALEAKLKELGQMWAENTLGPEAFQSAEKNLRDKLQALDESLRQLEPPSEPIDWPLVWDDEESPMNIWAQSGFTDVRMDVATRKPKVREWISTLVQEIVIEPARRKSNAVDLSRVHIIWRKGVERREP
jgi:site-specific DNA recombinase